MFALFLCVVNADVHAFYTGHAVKLTVTRVVAPVRPTHLLAMLLTVAGVCACTLAMTVWRHATYAPVVAIYILTGV